MKFKIIKNKFSCECGNYKFIFIDCDSHTNYNHYDPLQKCLKCKKIKTTWGVYCKETNESINLTKKEIEEINKQIPNFNNHGYERYSLIKYYESKGE